MTSLTETEAKAVERGVKERQRKRNGKMVCPRCSLILLATDPDGHNRISQLPEMLVRYSKISTNQEMPHEDVTWKCGDCRTHMWSSIKLEDDEIQELQNERNGRKYDPTAHPEQDAAKDRMRALGYIE